MRTSFSWRRTSASPRVKHIGGRYIVLPILAEGPLLDTYIARRLPELMAMQRDDPEWAMNNPLWLPMLQREREHTRAPFWVVYRPVQHARQKSIVGAAGGPDLGPRQQHLVGQLLPLAPRLRAGVVRG
jgi:hypothetical protein